VDKVAQHLGVSRATLHRQLSAEGGTFSSILESVRRDVAQRLQSESDRSLDDVASMLGFSSASAFAHWYRAGFGASFVRRGAPRARAALRR
jgi:AraC-like DNA-binding protein